MDINTVPEAAVIIAAITAVTVIVLVAVSSRSRLIDTLLNNERRINEQELTVNGLKHRVNDLEKSKK